MPKTRILLNTTMYALFICDETGIVLTRDKPVAFIERISPAIWEGLVKKPAVLFDLDEQIDLITGRWIGDPLEENITTIKENVSPNEIVETTKTEEENIEQTEDKPTEESTKEHGMVKPKPQKRKKNRRLS